MKKLLFLCLMLATGAAQAQVMNVFGDSYVQNHHKPYQETWHYRYAQERGFTYNNYGRNGSCIAFDRTKEPRNSKNIPMWQRYKVMDRNADLVVIIAGHNDAVKVKQNKDSLRMFTDSLNLVLNSIKAHCPKARIAFVTPWYVPREGFPEVCKMIRKVCKKQRVPVLWNHDERSIIQVRDPEFRKRYFQDANDTAHLNESGHTLFLPFGTAFLDRVMNSNGKYFEMNSYLEQ